MIAIGNILDSLKREIFDQNSSDPFIIRCSKKEQTIKRLIMRTFDELNLHLDQPDLEGDLNHWQKHKYDRNLKNLSRYIEQLYIELDKNKIEINCQNEKQSFALIEKDELILLINSYYVSIVIDILWSKDIAVSDIIKISKGYIDYENLSVKIPDKIQKLENEIIPYFEKDDNYKKFVDTLKEIIESYRANLNQGASVLCLIAIEGLVRELGKHLIKKQGLDQNYSNKQYNSLNSYLRNIPWKEDILIDGNRLMFITGDFKFHDDNPNIESEQVNINLKTRLDFLRRTFKNERDLIMHGELSKIGEPWDLYRNFSALLEVYEVIKFYDNKQ